MKSNQKEILQSFYPNKLLYFGCTFFFAACTAIIFHVVNNPNSNSGGIRIRALLNLPLEFQYLIILISFLMTLIPLLTLIPNGMYIKVTKYGLIYKSFLTFFQPKSIEWNLIDDFYIWSNPQNESIRYVKIKYIKNINQPVNDKYLTIPGDPDKTLAILKKYLEDFK
tara:strand:+ start:66 stop:566 length:501 start_codon:yes stop_codon:yes gene_type:complete